MRRASTVARNLTVAVQLFDMINGGIESWFLSLAKASRGIDWRVWTETRNVDSRVSAELRAVASIHDRFDDAVEGVDAVLFCGATEHRFSGRSIAVSHGAGAWTRGQMELLSWCGEYVAVSRQASRVCQREATVIENGVDLERCKPTKSRDEIRKTWGLADSDIAVGHVGRFSAEKRLDIIADAVKLYGPRAVAVFVGDHGTKEQLRAYCDSRSIRAIFPGSMRNVGNAFNGFDCAAVTSGQEGFCLAAVEAIAADCPLITTNVGIIPDINRRFGESCTVVPCTVTPKRLANEIDGALSAKTRTVEAGKNIRQHFSAERMANDWANFLAN